MINCKAATETIRIPITTISLKPFLISYVFFFAPFVRPRDINVKLKI